MSRALSFFVPIIPKGQARHPSVDWKAQFAALAAQHIGSEPPFEQGVPLLCHVEAYFPRPKRLLTKKSPAYPLPYLAKPDADNVGKIVLDALAPWMHDDAQVCDLRIEKWYCSTKGDYGVPGLQVTIKEWEPCEF
jgi:Holliday junction resolvase RusA-like endonuclease